MHIRILISACIIYVFIAACNSSKKHRSYVKNADPQPCTFTNPVGKGQDPWVIKHHDYYYFIESKMAEYIFPGTKSSPISKSTKKRSGRRRLMAGIKQIFGRLNCIS